MKIVIASDLHGNLEALERLPRDADACLIAGDLVDYGPDSPACVEWVLRGGWPTVIGNHDRAVARGMDCGCSYKMKSLSQATRNLVRQDLSQEHIAWLDNLPEDLTLEMGGCRFFVTHAVPGDLHRYLAAEEKEVMAKLVGEIDGEVIVWGHTHLPYIKTIAGKTVVNPGSVGQPRDGIPQASWAEWEDGRLRLCRSPYPYQKTLRKIYASPLQEEVKKGLEYVLTRGGVPTAKGG